MPKEKRKSDVNPDTLIQKLMERGKKEGKIRHPTRAKKLQDFYS